MKRFKKNYMPTLVSAVVHSILFLVLAFWGLTEEQAKRTLSFKLNEEEEAEIVNFEIQELEIEEPEVEVEEEVEEKVELETLSSLPESAMPLPQEAAPITAVALSLDPPQLQALSTAAQANALASKESDSMENGDGLGQQGEGEASGQGTGNGSGGSGNGGKHYISFLGARAYVQKVVFVVDSSASMDEYHSRKHGKKSELVTKELAHAIKQLNKNVVFQVILFDRTVKEYPDKSLKPATQENKEQVISWVKETVDPRGSTEPFDAMERAFTLNPDVIYLLTDGEFIPNPVHNRRLIQNIISRNVNNVPIIGVGIADRNSHKSLQPLAQSSGGGFVFVQ